MPIAGMTGFARVEGAGGGRNWSIEARSVNGRGLDVRTRLPPGWDALETSVRDSAARRFKRGSLQVTLTLGRDADGASHSIAIDFELLDRLIAAASPYVETGRVQPPRWDGLLQVRGVLTTADKLAADVLDQDTLAAIDADLARVFDALAAARAEEGRALRLSLGEILDRIERAATEARAVAASAPESIAQRIMERVKQAAVEVTLDPGRLAQEVALIASRADVHEEVERLAAHIEEAKRLLGSDDAVGRRLDFLTQELNREANTLCSKAFDIELSRIGLDLKAAIDQFKEQSANVE